jgi:dTDP-glucose 4,6-dehydratase
MKILITGGAGFIGSNLSHSLIRHTDWHIHVLDKLTYAGNLQSLQGIINHPRFGLTVNDICHRGAVEALLNEFQPDAILHLAAESHVDRSLDAPDSFIRTNLVGTFELLAAARAYYATRSGAQKDRFRFVHVSTDEVFGSLDVCAPPANESTRYAPSSPYSASKAGSDHLVRSWFTSFQLPVLITNCSNNYGPYQFPEKFIPVVILKAIRHEPIPIYGDGQNIRDWLYVEDHVDALLHVLTKGQAGQTYNIGANNERTNLDVVTRLCHILDGLIPKGAAASGGPANQSYAEQITFVADRPGHDFRYGMDATKIRTELHWKPKTPFEEGLLRTVEWYLNHRPWWEAVLSGSYRMERLGTGGMPAGSLP